MIENPIICDCNDIDKAVLVENIAHKNLKTTEQVGDHLRAGTVCGGCQADIQDLLDELNQ